MSKTGRPPKPVADVKKETACVRLTSDEKEALLAKAKADGKSFSDWARPILLAHPGTK